ncbi:LicD family protein, partial [Streptococcus pyogenes]
DTVGYDQLFCKLSDKATFIEDETSENPYEIGVSIDIFPIDGLGKTYNESLKIFNETKFFRELLIASRWTRFFRSKSRPIWIEP